MCLKSRVCIADVSFGSCASCFYQSKAGFALQMWQSSALFIILSVQSHKSVIPPITEGGHILLNRGAELLTP